MDCVLCSLPKYALTSPLQGPAILKAALAAHGFSSQVLDLNQEMGRRLGDLFPNLSWEDLEPLLLMHPSYSRIRPQIQQLCKEWAQRIAALQPRSVGVSIFTDRSEWIAEDFLQSLRTHVPYAKIIIGGAHCEYVADRFVQLNLADYAIIGEGEQILPELLMGGFTDPRKVIKIPFLNDLSLVPIPDYTDLNMNRYYGLYLSASRSCPHHCRFCEVFKRFGPFRLRPVGQVMDELRTLAGKYPHLKLFYFTDSLLNGDMGYFRDLLQELSRSDLDITWEGFLTVPNEKQMTPEDFDLLSQSGAHLVKIGVESGSPEVRQHMGKI